MESQARYVAVGIFSLFVLAAGIVVALWARGPGGLGAHRSIEVRFAGPAPGVRVGAPVTFNGVRVGEVSSVYFDAGDPTVVGARLSVQPNVPVSSTTGVSVDATGLMGGAEIALRGGSSDKPLVDALTQKAPVLQAQGSASVTEQARKTLAELQGVVEENAKPFRSLVADLQTFAAALSRNSDKVDGILSGLERMIGGPPDQKEESTFDLVLPKFPDAPKIEGSAQLIVAEPTTFIALDTQKIMTQDKDGQIVLQQAKWSDTTPKLVQRKLLEAMDSAGYSFASAPADTLNADLQLLTDVRRFQIVAGGQGPTAIVELKLRLVGEDGKMIGSRLVRGSAPASAMDGAEAAQALTRAFAGAARETLQWLGTELAKETPLEKETPLAPAE